jgi:hypothetical protein
MRSSQPGFSAFLGTIMPCPAQRRPIANSSAPGLRITGKHLCATSDRGLARLPNSGHAFAAAKLEMRLRHGIYPSIALKRQHQERPSRHRPGKPGA